MFVAERLFGIRFQRLFDAAKLRFHKGDLSGWRPESAGKLDRLFMRVGRATMRNLPPQDRKAERLQTLGNRREVVAGGPDAARQQPRNREAIAGHERAEQRSDRAERVVDAQ